MRTVRSILVVSLGLLLAAGGVARAGFPEVVIAPQTVDVAEGEFTYFAVSLSSPPAGFTFIQIVSVDGSATAGEDFVPVQHNLTWQEGETSPRKVPVETLLDEDSEGPETFTITLGPADGAVAGDLSTATITILDGDTDVITGTIVVDGSVQNDEGVHVFMVEAGQTVDIDVELSQVPAEPLSVGWTSSFAPFSGTLVFDGTRTATATLTGPDPQSVPAVTGMFSLTVGRGDTISWSWVLAQLASGLLSPEECAFCYLYFLYHATGLGDCPFECVLSGFCDVGRTARGTYDPNPALETLRDYRDDILAATTTGQYYVDLYAQHEVDAISALLGTPTLVFRVLEAQTEWIPALRSLVDGGGDGVTVTASMQTSLATVLDGMEANASPELAAALATERSRLQLDSIAGLTMDAFQQQIEDLGGTPVRRATWSSLKSRHR